MRKKAYGYTLAEILVTVGIIGVVAAITIPGFVLNSRNVTDVAAVARGVELIQNGMKNILSASIDNSEDGSGITTLSALQRRDVLGEDTENPGTYMTDGDLLFSATEGLMGTEEVDNAYLAGVRDYSGNNTARSIYDFFNNCTTYRFAKTNIVVIFQPVDNASIGNNIADDDVITRVFIDANGDGRPNQFGRDIFLFGLTNSGTLVPAGSEAYNKNIFNEELALYTEDCSDEIGNGLACSARIMADNWSVKY